MNAMTFSAQKLAEAINAQEAEVIRLKREHYNLEMSDDRCYSNGRHAQSLASINNARERLNELQEQLRRSNPT